jgi:hypothetical protein
MGLALIAVAAGILTAAIILTSSTGGSAVYLHEAKATVLSNLGTPCHAVSMPMPGYRHATLGIWKNGASFTEVVFATGWRTNAGKWALTGRSEVVAEMVSRANVRAPLCSRALGLPAFDLSVWQPLYLINPRNGKTYCYSLLPDADIVGYVCGHKPHSAPLPRPEI